MNGGRGAAEDARRIVTTDLILDPVGEDDVDELHALFIDPDVRRYLLDDRVVDRAWVEEEVRGSRELFHELGCGLWAIRPDGDGIVGFAGIRRFFEPPRPQLLYGLGPGARGRGWATQAARAIVELLFDERGWARVEAATDRPNLASIRVLERLGMTLRRETDDGVDGTLFFAVDNPERRGPASPRSPPVTS